MENDSQHNLNKTKTSMNLPKKRLRHNFLCIKDKLELISKYKQGYSKSALSREYSIGKSTVGDIINYENNLLNFQKNLSSEELNKRKKTKRQNFLPEILEGKKGLTKAEDEIYDGFSTQIEKSESKFISHSEALNSINLLVDYLEEELNSKYESLSYLKVLQGVIRSKVYFKEPNHLII